MTVLSASPCTLDLRLLLSARAVQSISQGRHPRTHQDDCFGPRDKDSRSLFLEHIRSAGQLSCLTPASKEMYVHVRCMSVVCSLDSGGSRGLGTV